MKPLESQRLLSDEQRIANLNFINELKRGFNRKELNKPVLNSLLKDCHFIVSQQKVGFYLFTSEYDFINSKRAIEERFNTELSPLKVLSVSEIINEHAGDNDTLKLSINRFILNHLITITHALKKNPVTDYSIIVDPLAFE